MFRTIIIYGGTILATVILAVVAMGMVPFSRTGNMPHLVARFWGRLILFISGVDVAVEGASRIDPDRSCIYMANHQSNFDIPVLLAHLPVQFRWLAKAELFKIPLFGQAMRGCGYISIDRTDRDSAFQSLREAARIIKSGTSVVIFPEGTRSLDGRIRPFKKGPFVLAIDAGVPIVPVVIHGTWHIMPKKRLTIKPCKVKLSILPSVGTTGYKRENKDALMEKIRNVLRARFAAVEGDPSCN